MDEEFAILALLVTAIAGTVVAAAAVVAWRRAAGRVRAFEDRLLRGENLTPPAAADDLMNRLEALAERVDRLTEGHQRPSCDSWSRSWPTSRLASRPIARAPDAIYPILGMAATRSNRQIRSKLIVVDYE